MTSFTRRDFDMLSRAYNYNQDLMSLSIIEIIQCIDNISHAYERDVSQKNSE